MELSLVATLAVFILLALSSAAFFLARRTGIPHTVLLVGLGVTLIPLSNLSEFAFLKDFILTPELLFYIFLPTLIFESAYNINIRRLTADAIPVSLLSIVSLLISALTVTAALYYLLPLVGFPIPLTIAFLFGALISATDPVAVLALFKEYGAPRRLALLFEGESLFNDGTGLALFLIALEFAIKNEFTVETIASGALSFLIMITGGAILGLVFGGFFSKAIGWARASESVAITLTLVLAHVTFLTSEYLSSHLHIGEFHIHFSSIIATTIAAMVMGNYGRPKLPHGAEEFVEKFWGQVAFFANSIIFILIGMLAVSLPLGSPELFVPIILVVAIVAIARALSIYPVAEGWNRFTTVSKHIPRAWQHLLAWGSLRGALAVTMALLVPVTLTVPEWANATSVRDTILAFATGCVFVTLFFKATTIGPMMRRLKVVNLSSLETAEYDEARALVYAQVLRRLARFFEKEYVTKETYDALRAHYEKRFEESCAECAVINTKDEKLAEAALRVWALGIEKRALSALFTYGELSEHAYKDILAKLALRTEQVERGLNASDIHVQIGFDIFEACARSLRSIFGRRHEEETEEKYMYYRAQMIIARKARKELAKIRADETRDLFTPNIVDRVDTTYASFSRNAAEKASSIAAKHPSIAALSIHLAHSGVLKVEEYMLKHFIEHEMITPKVHAKLQEELEREVEEVRAA